MPRVAVSSNSQLAADAGARIAGEGGNAVDAAVAALLVSLVTEPSICSLGGGAFVTIGTPNGSAITIDGYVEMPGRGLPAERFGGGAREARLGYGGGVDTTVGHGSVATPGTPAALALACEREGRLPWAHVVEPALEWARSGFPLSKPARLYLGYSGEPIYGWDPQSRAALYPEGRLLEEGETVRIPELAETLERLARLGVEDFYRGETARRIAAEMEAHGGILTLDDLERYRAVVREPLEVDLGAWRFATNPPPAVGGVTLAAMLVLMGDRPRGAWSEDDVRHLAKVQERVVAYRGERLDTAEDLEVAAHRLLERETLERLAAGGSSPSTVHTSAVDGDGLACAISASTGYGSGVMPPGTGVWLNNCLGERELNRRGFHALAPGTRLASNMAPSVALSADGAALAIGTPGADRITSALLLTMVNFIYAGMTLEEAIAHPRLHVERVEGEEGREATFQAACEPGLPVSGLHLPVRWFDELHMYFGGVGAVLYEPGRGFVPAADPRRTGGVAVGGRGRARS